MTHKRTIVAPVFPNLTPRIDTGPISIGEESDGIFLRSKHAFELAAAINAVLIRANMPENIKDVVHADDVTNEEKEIYMREWLTVNTLRGYMGLLMSYDDDRGKEDEDDAV